MPCPGEYLRLHPLLSNRSTGTKKYGLSEKTQLSDEQIANLSDEHFKTLVIRMLTEMIECGCKIQEKVKAMKSEIKENKQGTNSEGK